MERRLRALEIAVARETLGPGASGGAVWNPDRANESDCLKQVIEHALEQAPAA